ncbi:MAG TPA: PH domain-containing protein [Thermomicrobiaceae bacterium]|nr:PH domain-containing protein [Thermomicrobiaceae bacterium]
MAYIDGLLGDGERVLVMERRDPLFLVGHVAPLVIVAAALLGVGGWLAASQTRPGGAVVMALAIVPVAVALWRFLWWQREQYFITNFRIMQIEGIVSKRVLDSSLEMVNDIQLKQSLFGRIFDYGDLEILTASDVGVNLLHTISQPFKFKRAIIDARTRMSSGHDGPGGPSDAAMRLLAALNDLRDSGMLSDAEYQAKRAQLMGEQQARR